MAKVSIGNSVNSVTVEYAAGADNQVEPSLLSLLKAVIKSDIAAGQTLTSIYVSATTNGTHESPRHASGQAIDISRINGLHMSTHYSSDSVVKAIVNALQTQADAQSGIRENFGPHFKHKHAAAWSVAGHADHIHWSVD